ncbi:hypothetical protein [Haloplanus natans]|uniref:hypothetical protein n=1 Tax=Haloplanus natans TaxID=376171 RepID=UPI0012FCD902|nr:hypothetical protein [Haloplanus natans]
MADQRDYVGPRRTETYAGGDRSARDVVRVYLLDHRTPLGKVIDVASLGLNR